MNKLQNTYGIIVDVLTDGLYIDLSTIKFNKTADNSVIFWLDSFHNKIIEVYDDGGIIYAELKNQIFEDVKLEKLEEYLKNKI